MKAYKLTVVVFAVAMFSVSVVAQDDCANAVVAACNGAGVSVDPCSDTTPAGPLGSCTLGGGLRDVWVTFVATDTSARIRTDLGSTGTDSDYVVYWVLQRDVCNEAGWVEIGCSEDDALCILPGRLGDICVSGLVVGDTYLIRLGTKAVCPNGPYSVNVKCPCAPCQPADCNDSNACTTDTCPLPSDCCVNTPICTTAANCDDGDVCTQDICLATGCCDNPPIAGCCTSQAECTGCEDCVNNVCVDSQSKCVGCEDCVNGACVDDQAKCIGCEDCVNGACVDDQAKCTGCEDCVNGTCVDDQAKCIGCEDCVNGACVPDSSKCAKCETCNSSGVCIKDVPNCCTSDAQCGKCETCNLADNTCNKDIPGCCTSDLQCGMCETCDLTDNVCVGVCGNSICEPSCGEDMCTCPQDCGAPPPDDCNNNGILDACENKVTKRFGVACVPGECSNGTEWSFLFSWLPRPAKGFVNLKCGPLGAGVNSIGATTAFVQCVNNTVCPSIVVVQPVLNNYLRALFDVTAPVTPSGPTDFEMCVGPGNGDPRTCCFAPVGIGLACTFNPEVIEIIPSQTDCNANGVDDASDIFLGILNDANGDGIPDECEDGIPAVSAWGLVLLALLLLTGTKIYFGRRRRAKMAL